jgi:signal transduction histidine kinase
MHRYWAVGWVIYSIGAIMGVLLSTSNLWIFDIFPLSGMYIGATLTLDGSKGKKLTRKRSSIYIVGVVLFLLLLLTGLFLSWPFYFVFTPLGLHIAYVCFLQVKIINEMKEPIGLPIVGLYTGLMIWGVSWILFPFMAPIPDLYIGFMVMQAAGVILSGVSMLTFFMMTVTRDLERQSKVTQIMSSLVQHDIRNYIQVARLALDLTEDTDIINNHWIDVASSSLEGAKDFVDEMRSIAISLAQSNLDTEKIQLLELVNLVKERVITEYSIDRGQIKVEISEDTKVEVCPLAKELLWNIFDNAFKHNSNMLLVSESNSRNPHVMLQISDRGGGLPEDIKDYLNNPYSLSGNVPRGMGLGIVLIHGLATMCRSSLRVKDYVENSNVVGTTFSLKFRTST